MLKKFFLLPLLIVFIGCLSNNDDDGIDCALFDPAIPFITITYVDSEGNNLIRNGSLNPEDIIILRADGSVGGAVILPAEGEETPENNPFNYTIGIALPRSETETYTIQLDNTTIDELQLTARRQNLLCGLSYYTPTSAIYNDLNTTLIEDTIDFRIRIVR